MLGIDVKLRALFPFRKSIAVPPSMLSVFGQFFSLLVTQEGRSNTSGYARGYPLCEKSDVCLLSDIFSASFPKSLEIYFTWNDQNHPDDALIVPTDSCLSKFVLFPCVSECLMTRLHIEWGDRWVVVCLNWIQITAGWRACLYKYYPRSCWLYPTGIHKCFHKTTVTLIWYEQCSHQFQFSGKLYT